MITLILEKKETSNSKKLKIMFGINTILELYALLPIRSILKKYNPQDIKRIIFHASGQDGVTPKIAAQYLKDVLKWKNQTTILYAVSEGANHRTIMNSVITDLKEQFAETNSYSGYVRKVERKIREG
jgi:hypothetical protein